MPNSLSYRRNKHYLILCELHNSKIHGKTKNSDPHIENHYIVYDRFDPVTGVSLGLLDEYPELDTDNEYDSDYDMEDRELCNLNNEMKLLKEIYSSSNPQIYFLYNNHPTIRNYKNIVLNPNYIKPEIGEYIILPTQETIAILKTFWLRIIQKKWKKVFKERKYIISQHYNFSNLFIKEKMHNVCLNLPGLKGMLCNIKKF